MPRDIPVGNGYLLVNFDRDYQIRDIYYPHVGKENQAGREPCRFGVWADGQFSWMGAEWKKTLNYRDDTIVTDVIARNDHLGIELFCSDCVDHLETIFIRQIRVKNLRDSHRDVRLFFHHDLNMYENSTRDTVSYDPSTRSMIHYKDKRYCLIDTATNDRFGVDQYAAGEKGAAGREGTWRDAEDGVLGGNPIAHGSVDSTVGVNIRLEPNGEQACYLWLAFGTEYAEVKAYNDYVWSTSPAELIRRAHNYWLLWSTKEDTDLSALPEDVRKLYIRSLLILRTQADADGGMISSGDSEARHFGQDSYSYVRPREGALMALGLDAAGYPEMSRSFFTFCTASMAQEGFLLPKYFADRAAADTRHPWVHDGRNVLPIQEDSTAMVIYALWQHFNLYRDLDFIEPLYSALILPAAEFMAGYIDHETHLPHESWDVWDEHYGVHTYTVCTVIAALWSAAKFARAFGDDERAMKFNTAGDNMKQALGRYFYHNDLRRFARSGYRREQGYELDTKLDSLLVALFAAGVFAPDDYRVASTMEQVWNGLWVNTDVGGVARYEDDPLLRVNGSLPGNPWTYAALALAHWKIVRAENVDDLNQAVPLMQWVCRSALPSGVLPEQVNPYTNEPISASPASVTHGRLLHVAVLYLDKLELLQPCPMCGRPQRTHRRQPQEELNAYELRTVSESEARPAEKKREFAEVM